MFVYITIVQLDRAGLPNFAVIGFDIVPAIVQVCPAGGTIGGLADRTPGAFDLAAIRMQPHTISVLVLDADPAAIYVRVHTLDLSSMPPARHRAYAYQWFTFAIAAVVIFLVLHRKRKRRLG